MNDYQWNQTPWDHLDREALLRTLMTYAAALSHARMALMFSEDTTSPFWRLPSGTGAGAYAKAKACKTPDFPALRYLDSVAWPHLEHLGVWQVCPECNAMAKSSALTAGMPCSALLCGKPHCTGTIRPLTWDDLRAPSPGATTTPTPTPTPTP